MQSKEMELKRPKLREKIDLEHYADMITRAVQNVIPDAIVKVYPKYYVTETKIPITHSQASQMGRQIVQLCPELASQVKEYLYGENLEQRSGQLFVKRKK